MVQKAQPSPKLLTWSAIIYIVIFFVYFTEDSDLFIPLVFEHRHFENLQNICKQYRSKWLLHTYLDELKASEMQPEVDKGFIDFRWVEPIYRPRRPVRIEVLRCSNKYAIISADDGSSGYLLETEAESTIFNIFSKFQYTEQAPTESRLRTLHAQASREGQEHRP